MAAEAAALGTVDFLSISEHDSDLGLWWEDDLSLDVAAEEPPPLSLCCCLSLALSRCFCTWLGRRRESGFCLLASTTSNTARFRLAEISLSSQLSTRVPAPEAEERPVRSWKRRSLHRQDRMLVMGKEIIERVPTGKKRRSS